MDRIEKSVQHVTASSASLTRASAEFHRKNVLAAERTKLMLDCFRTGGANSPETFVAAIAATLARYPDEVIYEVTDPRTGLPSQLTWMPTIKEVYDACERILLPIRVREEREKRIAEQLEARRLEDERQANKPTYDQLKDKYGPDWGITVAE